MPSRTVTVKRLLFSLFLVHVFGDPNAPRDAYQTVTVFMKIWFVRLKK